MLNSSFRLLFLPLFLKFFKIIIDYLILEILFPKSGLLFFLSSDTLLWRLLSLTT
ncbi:hypothetical protein HMPREF0322_01334 [Desulfitobacterium hafniense DP7]|uniref:Uncharacterized protein n=1 Tax=Desulfitobacterium hafniense DP7 TaxID=537010 RepID=G9XK51_DESHA|nr:hypothetical protein HMPREF0322_01334 [Desulfitobacterium hafniense DP7]